MTTPTDATDMELSVVMPCLNEADTLAICVRKALAGIQAAGVTGEVVVADNGSSDGSREIARAEGARVVEVSEPGYGNALMGGIDAALGRWVIMGDADDSYDFEEIPKFVDALRAGSELAQGCRLPAGGGTVLPDAMPFLHRWWGNPMFTQMVRSMFQSPIHDVYCGMRGFTKELYDRLALRCGGMEFATEMIIKASLTKADITEVPITLHPDGREAHAPHLRTFRDGWRTLRFFLMLSPRWLFFVPGVVLILLGLAGFALSIPETTIGEVRFHGHTMVFSGLALIVGEQAIFFALFTKYFAVYDGLLPSDSRMDSLFKVATLERGLALSALAICAGALLLFWVVARWVSAGFGDLDYMETLSFVIPGSTLVALGFQTAFSSFFLSILGMSRR